MEDSPRINLSKLDVARRQLECALNLFFYGGDIVAIHSLTSNAHEILATLAKKQKIASFVFDTLLSNIKPEKRKEVKIRLSNPRNFFKHAEKDPNATLSFSEGQNHYILYDACLLYTKLTDENPELILAFTLWFSVKNNEMFIDQNIKQTFKNYPDNPSNKLAFLAGINEAYKELKYGK